MYGSIAYKTELTWEQMYNLSVNMRDIVPHDEFLTSRQENLLSSIEFSTLGNIAYLYAKFDENTIMSIELNVGKENNNDSSISYEETSSTAFIGLTNMILNKYIQEDE